MRANNAFTTPVTQPLAASIAARHRHVIVAAANRGGRMRGAPARQRGVALIVALLLLIVMTLVGFAAVHSTLLQQKMSSNMYDREIAFQSAESALRAAENSVQAYVSLMPSGVRDCTPASSNACLENPFDNTSLPGSDIVTVPTGTFDAGSLAPTKPQYVVEYMGRFPIPPPGTHQVSSCPSGYSPASCGGQVYYANFYRITARNGAPADIKNRASVTLQSIYKK